MLTIQALLICLASALLQGHITINWKCPSNSDALLPSTKFKVDIRDIKGHLVGYSAVAQCAHESIVFPSYYPHGVYFARISLPSMHFDSPFFHVGFSGSHHGHVRIALPSAPIQMTGGDLHSNSNAHPIPPPPFTIRLVGKTLRFSIPCSKIVDKNYQFFFSAAIYDRNVKKLLVPLGSSVSSCKQNKFSLNISSTLSQLPSATCFRIVGMLSSGNTFHPMFSNVLSLNSCPPLLGNINYPPPPSTI